MNEGGIHIYDVRVGSRKGAGFMRVYVKIRGCTGLAFSKAHGPGLFEQMARGPGWAHGPFPIRIAWIFLTTVYVLNLSKQGVKSLPSWFALMQGCLVGWLLPD